MDLTSPYNNITPESIKSEILADIKTRSGDVDVQEGAYTNTLVSGVAYRLYAGYQHLQQMLFAAFPDETSGEFIDKAAASVGLQRKKAEKAAVVLTFAGQNGTTVPAGTAAYASVSGLRFQTTEDTTLVGESASAPAEAADGGAEYNLPAGEINSMYVNVAGISGVTNLQAAAGGTDEESDEAFFARYATKMTLAPTSNNPDQYIIWALEVPGVAYAQCIPVWAGAGTVKVIVAGEGRMPVDDDVLQACREHLAAQRVIGVEITVANAVHREVDLTGQITLGSGYTLEGVMEQLTRLSNDLLSRVPFGQESVIPYSKFLSCLLQCDGVDDYAAFEVDGAGDPLHINAGEVWTVGVVDIAE